MEQCGESHGRNAKYVDLTAPRFYPERGRAREDARVSINRLFIHPFSEKCIVGFQGTYGVAIQR